MSESKECKVTLCEGGIWECQRHELQQELDAVRSDRSLLDDCNINLNYKVIELEKQLADAKAQIKDYGAALEAITKRHDWHPDLGQCICEEHKKAKETLKKWKG